jgi:hypothetical protein
MADGLQKGSRWDAETVIEKLLDITSTQSQIEKSDFFPVVRGFKTMDKIKEERAGSLTWRTEAGDVQNIVLRIEVEGSRLGIYWVDKFGGFVLGSARESARNMDAIVKSESFVS